MGLETIKRQTTATEGCTTVGQTLCVWAWLWPELNTGPVCDAQRY